MPFFSQLLTNLFITVWIEHWCKCTLSTGQRRIHPYHILQTFGIHPWMHHPTQHCIWEHQAHSGPPCYCYYLQYTRLQCYTRTNVLQGSHILCWSCRLSCNLHCHWSYPDQYSKSLLGNYQSQWQLGPHDFHRWLLKSRGISWGQYLKTRINLY